ncbi:hypothetical protein FQN50_004894 [Emmonsiellopsis sp. PD_5]|nr:hypothetical protein FQN50_004894 [Emmonsiellopsis sp. PD_5]
MTLYVLKETLTTLCESPLQTTARSFAILSNTYCHLPLALLVALCNLKRSALRLVLAYSVEPHHRRSSTPCLDTSLSHSKMGNPIRTPAETVEMLKTAIREVMRKFVLAAEGSEFNKEDILAAAKHLVAKIDMYHYLDTRKIRPTLSAYNLKS